MTEINPSWRQLSEIQFCPVVHRTLRALGIEPPAAGLTPTFNHLGVIVTRHQFAGGVAWAVYRDGGSRMVDSPQEVLQHAQMPPGTTSGDALRQWLRWWGWEPPSKPPPPELNDNTRTVI